MFFFWAKLNLCNGTDQISRAHSNYPICSSNYVKTNPKMGTQFPKMENVFPKMGTQRRFQRLKHNPHFVRDFCWKLAPPYKTCSKIDWTNTGLQYSSWWSFLFTMQALNRPCLNPAYNVKPKPKFLKFQSTTFLWKLKTFPWNWSAICDLRWIEWKAYHNKATVCVTTLLDMLPYAPCMCIDGCFVGIGSAGGPQPGNSKNLPDLTVSPPCPRRLAGLGRFEVRLGGYDIRPSLIEVNI